MHNICSLGVQSSTSIDISANSESIMPLSASEKLARVKAWLIPGVGAKTFEKLRSVFGSLERAWHASQAELMHHGFSKKFCQAWRHTALLEEKSNQILAWSSEPDQHLLFRGDPDYPNMLKHLKNTPPLLFAKGQIEALNDPYIAIVGSRSPTGEGLRNARDMAAYLASRGLGIVSGLAKGIDTAAHQGALQAGGPTVGVVAHGLDEIYPKSNKLLAKEVAASGLLMSEFPLGMGPRPQHFPRRNALISGLSLGVCVVEAALRSGSLITAKWGLEQGREVFAVPGSIHNPLSKGCHHLIRQGAKLVESADDIFEELLPLLKNYLNPLDVRSGQEVLESSDQAKELKPARSEQPYQMPIQQKQAILEALSPSALDILKLLREKQLQPDDILIQLKLPTHELTTHLLALEMQQLIDLTPKGYSLTSKGYCF